MLISIHNLVLQARRESSKDNKGSTRGAVVSSYGIGEPFLDENNSLQGCICSRPRNSPTICNESTLVDAGSNYLSRRRNHGQTNVDRFIIEVRGLRSPLRLYFGDIDNDKVGSYETENPAVTTSSVHFPILRM